ncbi:hypothetical protein D3C72_2113830 [compost metagenome]
MHGRASGANTLTKPRRPKLAILLHHVDDIHVNDLVGGKIPLADFLERSDGLCVAGDDCVLQVLRPFAIGIEPYSDPIAQAVGGQNLVSHLHTPF